jgi:hypothetical protein
LCGFLLAPNCLSGLPLRARLCPLLLRHLVRDALGFDHGRSDHGSNGTTRPSTAVGSAPAFPGAGYG